MIDIANKINFFTDASALAKLGFGDAFGGHWMYSQWEKSFIEIHNPSIEFLCTQLTPFKTI